MKKLKLQFLIIFYSVFYKENMSWGDRIIYRYELRPRKVLLMSFLILFSPFFILTIGIKGLYKLEGELYKVKSSSFILRDNEEMTAIMPYEKLV